MFLVVGKQKPKEILTEKLRQKKYAQMVSDENDPFSRHEHACKLANCKITRHA